MHERYVVRRKRRSNLFAYVQILAGAVGLLLLCVLGTLLLAMLPASLG